MRRACAFATFVLTSIFTLSSGAEPDRAVVKKQAQQLGKAFLQGDYGKTVDFTPDSVVKQLGGRDKLIKAIEVTMNAMKARGATIKAYNIGEPAEFITEGDNTFVVVPTTMEMTFQEGTGVTKSYLVAISSDGGKAWKFIDGARLHNKELRDRFVPKLPAKLKLPKVEVYPPASPKK